MCLHTPFFTFVLKVLFKKYYRLFRYHSIVHQSITIEINVSFDIISLRRYRKDSENNIKLAIASFRFLVPFVSDTCSVPLVRNR